MVKAVACKATFSQFKSEVELQTKEVSYVVSNHNRRKLEMSRTFRRKSMHHNELRNRHYIRTERDAFKYYRSEGYYLELYWVYKGYASYDAYFKETLSQLKRDSQKYFVNYSKASKSFRKVRNRQLRARHMNAIKHFEEDIVLEPFVKNAAWDQW